MAIRIGIIGAGLSGTLVALKAMQHLKTGVEITLFERTPSQLFRGVAYSSSLPFQPLNVRASQMNVWHDRPGDFHLWLQQQWQKYYSKAPAADDFVGRGIFGDYLESSFKNEVSALPDRHSFRIVYEEVKQIDRENNQFVLTSDSTNTPVDYVVLALGNFLPADLPITDAQFYKCPLYEANPWNGGWMNKVQPEDDVLFLGSGLTMIDQAINLLSRPHFHGKIKILSRRGFIPRAHKKFKSIELPPLPVYLGITIMEVLQLVRKQIAYFEKTEVDWRNCIDAVRNQVPQIWAYLSIAERKKFLQHIRPFWEIHRHRIPESSLIIIEENIRSGRIELVAGRLVNLRQNGSGAEATIRPRGHSLTKQLNVQKVVNCTGPQSDFRKIEQPLIQNLSHKGLLKADELNLGLAVNKDGQLIDNNGEVVKNIYTIGSLRKGAMWECTALREITLQADQFVRKLISDLLS